MGCVPWDEVSVKQLTLGTSSQNETPQRQQCCTMHLHCSTLLLDFPEQLALEKTRSS